MLRAMADLEGLERPEGFGGSGGFEGHGAGLSEDDRTEAIERLKRHAAPGGVLSAEALADRVRRISQAQTRAGIDQVLADLPRDPPWSMPPGLPPVPGEELARRPAPPRAAPGRTLAFVLGGLAIVAGVAGALVVFASAGDDEDRAAETPSTELPASTLPPLAIPEAPATTATTAATTTTSLVVDIGALPDIEPEFVLQKVGQDIPPGRYLSTPEVSCYWERVKSFGGTINDVIINGGSYGDHLIVDVLASDAGLRSQGCDFRPYAAPANPATTFGDGDWLVGSDVAAGTYRLTEKTSELTGDASLCAWERATGFDHDYDEILDYAYPAGADVTIELHGGERFTSEMCGTWTRA